MYTIAQPFPIVIDAIPTVGKLGINGTSDPTISTQLFIATDGFTVELVDSPSNATASNIIIRVNYSFVSLSDLMQEGSVYVSITLLQNGKLNVFICTEDKTIYDEDHEMSVR